MRKIKTLRYLVVVLAALNIYLIASIVWQRQHRPTPEKGEKRLKELFAFNEKQIGEYRVSREEHKADMKKLQGRLDSTAISYYLEMDAVEKEKALEQVMEITRQIYLSNENHINDIRTIAKPEQQNEIENFVRALTKRGNMPPARRKNK